MTFSQFNRRRLLGYLREVEDEGGAMPNALKVMTRLGLDSVAVAEGLIAELIADGQLEVTYDGRRQVPNVLVATSSGARAEGDGLPRSPRRSTSSNVAPDGARQPMPPEPLPRGSAVSAEASPSTGTSGATPHHFERGRKPFIPAGVIRAARDLQQPLDLFVTTMIAIGFERWKTSDPDGASICAAIAAIHPDRKAAA